MFSSVEQYMWLVFPLLVVAGGFGVAALFERSKRFGLANASALAAAVCATVWAVVGFDSGKNVPVSGREMDGEKRAIAVVMPATTKLSWSTAREPSVNTPAPPPVTLGLFADAASLGPPSFKVDRPLPAPPVEEPQSTAMAPQTSTSSIDRDDAAPSGPPIVTEGPTPVDQQPIAGAGQEDEIRDLAARTARLEVGQEDQHQHNQSLDTKLADERAARERSVAGLARRLDEQLSKLQRRIAALEVIDRASPPPPVTAPAAAETVRSQAPPQSEPVARTQPEPRPAARTITLAELTQSLSVGRSTPSFILKPLPDKELILGQKANYYSVVLLDPNNGQRFAFASASYDVAGREAEFLQAFQTFYESIVAGLPTTITSKLYLRGYANSTGFKRPQALAPDDDALRSITYFPRQGSATRFSAALASKRFESTYMNDDLPLLRAAYCAEIIKQELGHTVELLQGEIKSDSDNPETRGIDLILQLGGT